MLSSKQIDELFARQIANWPAAAERIRDLQTRVERRAVGPYLVQFNPARAVSTLAKVDSASLAERPCFLCAHNRPAQQEGIRVLAGRWEVLVNPFPILDHHLTIVRTEHMPQRLTRQDLVDMLAINRMLPEYVVFYNGARCGASAPDHKHLQAGLANDLPLLQNPDFAQRVSLGPITDETELWETINSLSHEEGRDEADFNLLVKDGDSYIVPRQKHRPQSYHDGTLLISPGSLDVAGLIITPREEDFRKITTLQIDNVFAECCSVKQPKLSVGIMEAPEIHYTQHEDGFTLHDVIIGKSFHWQRFQDQRFPGALRIVDLDDKKMKAAINDVPVEQYLLSVISSEMSGTSSLELLKAHAVISRSWVMRMKERRNIDPISYKNNLIACHGNEHVVWYDSSAHKNYDVCADDHCQRYQGMAGVNPVVEQAIRETYGEVLVSAEGFLCDTRFSKCCGGRTELFSTCWQDEEYSYLQSVECPYCDTKDKTLLRQVLNSYDLETPHFHDWTVEYSQDELSELVERKLHLDVGVIENLVPVARGASGRISHMRVVGARHTIIVGKELEIRKMLSPTHLLSSWFDVEKTTDESGQIRFKLCGHGWGHGVGLCQIGAAVMAHEGKTYKEILQHYFADTHLLRIY